MLNIYESISVHLFTYLYVIIRNKTHFKILLVFSPHNEPSASKRQVNYKPSTSVLHGLLLFLFGLNYYPRGRAISIFCFVNFGSHVKVLCTEIHTNSNFLTSFFFFFWNPCCVTIKMWSSIHLVLPINLSNGEDIHLDAVLYFFYLLVSTAWISRIKTAFSWIWNSICCFHFFVIPSYCKRDLRMNWQDFPYLGIYGMQMKIGNQVLTE